LKNNKPASLIRRAYLVIRSKTFIIIAVFLLVTVAVLSAIPTLRNIFSPDVILITIDALRPDHLGCYGYERNTSPNIDSLAKEGVFFLNCFSPGSSTISAMPSFLSGKYLNIYDKEAVFNTGLKNILDERFTLLAEYLRQWGYHAEAFVTNGHLGPGSGFDQGFSRYCFDFKVADSKGLTSEVLRFLGDYRQRKPLFIWVHYMDAHIPFRHLDYYADDFESDEASKKKDKILQIAPEGSLYKNKNLYSSQGCIPKAGYIKGRASLNYYIGRYDAEIRYIDNQLPGLIKHLRKNSIIILSADHGESLGEHNIYFAHGENIYDEVLRVPLIIKDSGLFKGGIRIDAAASSVDIVPTILSRVNPVWYFFNKNKFDGIDLKAVMLKKKTKRKYIYSFYPWAFSIRDVSSDFKYIFNKNGREELYSLPDEDNNLIAIDFWKTDLIKNELRNKLEGWLKYRPIRCDINVKRMSLSDEERDNLRSLGYIQ